MPLLEITRAARFVTITNILLFAGALISALAIPLSIRANDKVQRLKDSRAERQRVEDQRKTEVANLQAKIANSTIRLLRTDLVRSDLRQQALEKKNSLLSLQLQQEREGRLLLEAMLSPRHLSEAQQQTMTRLLQPFRGSGIAFTRIQDQEAWEFAEDIFRPLYLAGWHFTDNDVGVFAPPRYGILFCVPERLRSDRAALALAAAFRYAQVDFSTQIVTDDELRLIVGLKPTSR